MTNPTNSRTHCLYLTDGYLVQTQATVQGTGIDEKGPYVVFNQTIFHPQGGGQPHDKGTFTCGGKTYTVTSLALDKKNWIVRHYFTPEEEKSFSIGAPVDLQVDEPMRTLHRRIHSAGHLMECAVAEIFPCWEAYKGNHATGGQASINFKEKEDSATPNWADARKQLEERVNELVAKALPVYMSWNKENTMRSVQFGDYVPLECGGTHMKNSEEIGRITVRSVGKRKGDIKIGYDVV